MVPGTHAERDLIIDELRVLDDEMGAMQMIRGMRRSLSVSAKGEGTSFLIQLDLTNGKMTATPFEMGSKAIAAALEAEKEAKVQGGKKHVALVSAVSVEALRRAYPNYFLDTKHFERLLAQAVN